MTQPEKDFIREHLHSDVNKLLLNPPVKFKEQIGFLVEQIVARQKAQHKLPRWFENYELEFPVPLSVEQSSSEDTASYKAGLFKGEKFIDLTGGMGVDSLAFSERFSSCTYVESDKKLTECFRHNCQVLGKEFDIHNAHAEDFLNSYSETADLIFIDPARRDNLSKKVFRFQDCSPNLIDLLAPIKVKTNNLLVKASPLIDLKQGLTELGGATEIHIVSVKNDCKEVLFILDFEKDRTSNPIIKTANLASTGNHLFNFYPEEEKSLTLGFSGIQQLVYIPNSSILKAGAFKSVANQTGALKLASNTHLYTSQEVIPDFPGRTFEIIEPDLDKKKLEKLAKKGMDVVSKNHPLKAHEIVKKYKLKVGGNSTLIAFRNHKNKPQMILTRLLESAKPK